MSVPVSPEDLGATASRYGQGAFLLTDGEDHRPHITHVEVGIEAAVVDCEVGRTAARNVATNPKVSLLWAPFEPEGHSLIADGDAVVETNDKGGRVSVSVSRAVLHRPLPAARTATSECESDCVELELPE